ISVADLALFNSWATCQKIQTEHNSDGARILALMTLAERFRAEQLALTEMRRAGQRTQFVETMYVLDLAIDKRVVPMEPRPVLWTGFADALERLGLTVA